MKAVAWRRDWEPTGNRCCGVTVGCVAYHACCIAENRGEGEDSLFCRWLSSSGPQPANEVAGPLRYGTGMNFNICFVRLLQNLAPDSDRRRLERQAIFEVEITEIPAVRPRKLL